MPLHMREVTKAAPKPPRPTNPDEAGLSGIMASAFATIATVAPGPLAAAVRAALRTDRAESVLDALDWDGFTNALTPMQATLHAALINAGKLVNLPSTVSGRWKFNDSDPRAVALADHQAGNLVRNITDQQRELIRQQVSKAVAGGQTVEETARQIAQSVGLTDRHAAAVEAAYHANVANSLKQGLSQAQAEANARQFADAYRKRLINSRAQTIARTEILAAQNQGRYLGWAQTIEQGYASTDSIKEWRTAPHMSRYGTPCSHCAPYDGQQVPWDQPFANGVIMPPAHSNCRCTAVLLPPDQKKNVQDQTEMGTDGYESQSPNDRGTGGFCGTRCDLCPGNCGRKHPVGLHTVVKALTACSGLFEGCPEHAVPVTKATEVDPGDTLWIEGSTKGYTVVGPGKSPSVVIINNEGKESKILVDKLHANGKKMAVEPGPVKVSKYKFPGSPGAAKPAIAPPHAVPVNYNEQCHPGDVLWTSTSQHKLLVLGPGPKGGVLIQNLNTGKKGEVSITNGAKGGKAYAIEPGPNKAYHALGLPHPDMAVPVTPEQKVNAGNQPKPTKSYTPHEGDLTGHKDFPGNSYIVEFYDKKADEYLIKSQAGTLFSAKAEQLVGLPTGLSLKKNGATLHIVNVDSLTVYLSDGSSLPKSSLRHAIENNKVQPVTATPGQGAAAGKPTAKKPTTAAPAKQPTSRPAPAATPTRTTVAAWPDPIAGEALGGVSKERLAVKPPKGMLTVEQAVDEAWANPTHGSFFAWDETSVQGLEVRVNRVVIDGKDHTEIRFVMTDENRDLFLNQQARTAGWDADQGGYIHSRNPETREIKLLRRNYNDETSLQIWGATSKWGSTHVRTLENGTRIIHTTSGEKFGEESNAMTAYHGTTRFFIEGKATNEQVAEAMAHVGIRAESNGYATAEAVNQYVENAVLHTFNKKGLAYGWDRDNALKEIYKKYKFTAADVEFTRGPNGELQALLPQHVADAFAKETRIDAFVHKLYNGISDLWKIARDPRQALMSTTMRRVEGIVGNGMSSDPDICSGGADYVFTRPRSRKKVTAMSDRIVWESRDLFRRLDWFAYDSDRYGRLTSDVGPVENKDQLVKGRDAGGAETMFHNYLSLNNAHMLCSSERERERLIAQARDNGITEIGGRPLEQFFIMATDFYERKGA